MERLPTKQEYVVAPADPIYHLALNDRLTLCQLWVHGETDQRRCKDDRRLVTEKPTGGLPRSVPSASGKPLHPLSLSALPWNWFSLLR